MVSNQFSEVLCQNDHHDFHGKILVLYSSVVIVFDPADIHDVVKMKLGC